MNALIRPENWIHQRNEAPLKEMQLYLFIPSSMQEPRKKCCKKVRIGKSLDQCLSEIPVLNLQ